MSGSPASPGVGGSGGFDLVVVANGTYDDPETWGPLPVGEAAEALAAALGPSGGRVVDGPHLDVTADQARKVLKRWVSGPRAAGTLLYWGGHGHSDGTNHWLVTRDTGEDPDQDSALRAVDLEHWLVQDWQRRAGDPGSWTVVVLDCCAARTGIRHLNRVLSGQLGEPERLALVAACGDGASFSGEFVRAVREQLGRLTENDHPSVAGFFGDVAAIVHGEARPLGVWSDVAPLGHPRAAGGVLTVTLDALDELRAALDRLPVEQAREVRSHFLAKAQGAELGEGGWYFRGRRAETVRIVRWLEEADTGLLVVTGAAGAGKSALLGRLVVLADRGLSGALATAGVLGPVPADELPPPDVFDVVVHLTGKTLAECVTRVAEALPELEGAGVVSPDELIGALRARRRDGLPRPSPGPVFTLLADALDEAQQPHAIAASFLRRLAATPGVRVVVGTRRSVAEGPDLPEPTDQGLLDAVGTTREPVVVDHDPEAVRAYIDARLEAAVFSPFSAEPVRRATAARISARQAPFLMARLAVTELVARPELADDPRGIDELLAAGHRGLFGAAIDRLGRRSATTVALLRSLAFGLGRGLPRAGGVWATVCGAVSGSDPPDPDALDAALEEAAAFVTLDGDDAQSTYRLAHQVFVEHFAAEASEGEAPIHAAIARGLVDLAHERGGWAVANPYILRRLPGHAALGGGLADLLSEPEALDHLGLAELRARVMDVFFGRWDIPAPALAVLREAEALERLAPPDRSPFRALVAKVDRPGHPPLTISPTAVVRPVLAAGAPARTHLTLRGHEGRVLAVAVGALADGRAVVASGGDDGTVRLWDPATGAAVSVLPVLTQVNGVAVHGLLAAVATSAGLIVLELGPFSS